MKILGIETSGKTGSVGACWDGGARERPFPGGTSHGRDLAPALDALMAELGWRLPDADLIAVSAGPGSYTGLRIGMAFAKALAFALDAPLVGVPSFDAMARTAPGSGGIVAPVLDARWGQMYAAAFERSAEGVRRLTEDLVGTVGEVVARIPRGALFFGPGAGVFRETIETRGTLWAPGPWDRVAAHEVARIGAERFRAAGPDDPSTLHPIYLRPTQAEDRRPAS